MKLEIQENPKPNQTHLRLTNHALGRMHNRHIHPEGIRMALDYGREFFVRGAVIFVLGKKDIDRAQQNGTHIPHEWEGIQVVVAHDGSILTTYKNRSLSGLRPRRKRRSQQQKHRQAFSGQRRKNRRAGSATWR
jgi:hypothetical protein